MTAQETKLQQLIEGTKQYVVPLYQRSYSWTKKEWDILWNDIVDLCEMENPRCHFFGSIVNMQTTSLPEGVSKFLLIDGQQRLTTVFILLGILKEVALDEGKQMLSDEIKNTLLLNQYKEGNDHYKFMPTQIDREAFLKIIDNKETEPDCQICKAWKYFENKVRSKEYEIEKIKNILTEKFLIVSISLDPEDNPYLVFESLNAKGRSLSQADLIKNYFFMRIPQSSQDQIYAELWTPMQDNLGEDLSEFIRHYMMRHGGIIKQTDVYYELKDKVTENNTIEYLKSLKEYSFYYRNMRHPELIQDNDIRVRFERLDLIEVTTAYPILLYFYGEYSHSNITKNQFCCIIDTLENYLIRRFVCDLKTNTLNKIFSSVYSCISKNSNEPVENRFKEYLASKGYPKDTQFSDSFKTTKLYGGGDRLKRTNLILSSLEESYGHKEMVQIDKMTIEHIMPQNLTEWWKEHLGEDFEIVHDNLLHTIGNLTLTGYNQDLSNKPFPQKLQYFKESHLELNKYLSQKTQWKQEDIQSRAEFLTDKALTFWPYFGNTDNHADGANKSFTKPTSVSFLGKIRTVSSWREVLEFTYETISEERPELFSEYVKEHPNCVNTDKNKFTKASKLCCGLYIEVKRSADSIYKECERIIQFTHLDEKDWKVEYEKR